MSFPERVQVIKQESTALGGDDADSGPAFQYPIDPFEDVIEAAGFELQEPDDVTRTRDNDVIISRATGEMTFKDQVVTSAVTLTDLLATGGITSAQHKVIRQLIHFIDDGPAEGFSSGAYREVTGTVFPSAVVWWESSSKLKKIVSKDITWSGVNATTIVWKMYSTDGSTVLATITDTISYSGIFETSRTRAIA